MPLKIGEINALEVGINYLDSSAAYDICLYSEFKDQNDLKIYQEHPEHLKVKDYIVSVVTDRAVVDYNIADIAV